MMISREVCQLRKFWCWIFHRHTILPIAIVCFSAIAGLTNAQDKPKPEPLTVIPLSWADHAKMGDLQLEQAQVLLKKQSLQLQMDAVDKELDEITARMNQAAADIAAHSDIDPNEFSLDLSKHAWVEKQVNDAKTK